MGCLQLWNGDSRDWEGCASPWLELTQQPPQTAHPLQSPACLCNHQFHFTTHFLPQNLAYKTRGTNYLRWYNASLLSWLRALAPCWLTLGYLHSYVGWVFPYFSVPPCINSIKKYHLFLALETSPILPSLHLFFADKPGRRQKLDSGCAWQWYSTDGFGSGLHNVLWEGCKPSICCEVKAGPDPSCSDLFYRCGRLWKRPLVGSRPCPGSWAPDQLEPLWGEGEDAAFWRARARLCWSLGWQEWVQQLWQSFHHERKPACGGVQTPNQASEVMERSGTRRDLSIQLNKPLNLLGSQGIPFPCQKSGFIFSTYMVSRSSFEQSYCHSAFLCSKKENDAALPTNSWGPSLLCDTLHMNLRATLAASHMWLQLLL